MFNPSPFYGKKIHLVNFDPDKSEIKLTFFDGTAIKLADKGQSCCEMRYISTDDEINSLCGKTLSHIEIKDGPIDIQSKYGDEYHDIQFLEIRADHDIVTFAAHNEHNGYYGGFNIDLEVV